jgi:cystathionine beta-lyase/cystathionine gamma-synthase
LQITPPISLSITYQQQKPGKYVAYDYSRDGNPTRDLLEENIAALEEARYCKGIN